MVLIRESVVLVGVSILDQKRGFGYYSECIGTNPEKKKNKRFSKSLGPGLKKI